MRFHIGFSKRISIKTILTLISALFVGFCAFLGITEHEIVYAAPVTLSPSSAAYYNNLSSEPFSPSISLVNNVGYQNLGAYYFAITNPGSSSFNFTYFYNAQNLCPDTNYRASGSFQYSLEGNNSGSNVSMVYSNGSTIPISLNNSVITFNNIDFSRAFKIVFNSADGNNSTGLYIDRGWNITCNTDPNQSVIDNQNQNTQDIINNNNQNTQDIIDNQNANNQAMIDSQLVCKSSIIDKNDIAQTGYQLLSDGRIVSATSFGITDFIQFKGNILKLSDTSTNYASICFYDSNKTLISCSLVSSGAVNSNLTIPSGSFYFRTSININVNRPTYSVEVCKNTGSAISDDLTDSNVDSNTGTDFFDMNINEHGIASILTSPIRLLQALTTSNNSCNPLNLTINLDGTSKEVSIPSGCILWDMVPNSISAIFIAIVYGLFAYYVLIDLYKFVHGLLDPDDKNMYVLDL